MARIRIRPVALPVEHGGWGFLFEPILLGLLVAPSAAGMLFSLAAISFFLLRHPLKLVLAGTGGWSESPRRRLALAFALGYAVLGIIAGALGISLSGPGPLIPFVLGSPLILGFLIYDAQRRSREFVAETLAPLGLAVTAPALAICAGWSLVESAMLWALLAARAVPSIFYVRATLRRLRGERVRRTEVMGMHLLVAGAGGALAVLAIIPFLAASGLLALALRASTGLFGPVRSMRAARVGIMEILYGLLFVGLAVAGYRLGI